MADIFNPLEGEICEGTILIKTSAGGNEVDPYGNIKAVDFMRIFFSDEYGNSIQYWDYYGGLFTFDLDTTVYPNSKYLISLVIYATDGSSWIADEHSFFIDNPVTCVCDPWVDGDCSGINYRHQSRVCTPSGCESEEQIVYDPSCECNPNTFTPITEYCPDGVTVRSKITCGDDWKKHIEIFVCPGVCSAYNIGACATETECSGVGGFWYNGACHATAEVVDEDVCAYATPQYCKTKTDCENISRFWYNNKCNLKPYKPVEENWLTQETLIPGVQNYILVTAGIIVPITAGGILYFILRKPSKRGKK